MSQEQPERPKRDEFPEQEPIKYGDVFNVSGELATQPIKPKDAALMQATENQALGQTQKGGPASVMQSAAAVNTAAGLVNREDISDIAKNQGVSVSNMKVGGNRVITESVGSQVLGQFVEPDVPMNDPGLVLDPEAITIGEALEASALSRAGNKALDQSDAAAIQAAEMRATGRNHTEPGGLGANAQAAATRNARTMPLQKTTLGDVVSVTCLTLNCNLEV